MRILSYNPGHDGAVAFIRDGRLVMSLEAEKGSAYRHSPVSALNVLDAVGEIDDVPDVVCVGGWWPRDRHEHVRGPREHAGYRGVAAAEAIMGRRRFMGREIHHFSSSHERSHVLCAFGMSELPKGTRCHALVWEGGIGAFYDLDADLNVTRVADVMDQPGNRYGLLYGLADPTFPKDWSYPRLSDAGKLMALASFSKRAVPTPAERGLLEYLLNGPYRPLDAYDGLARAPHRDVGLDDPDFRDFTGIFSDALFDVFYRFAEANLDRRPLVIAGGCGLNCDWNAKWRDCGLFTDVFVPPVANDSGSAIGTAIDAQFRFTGNPKIEWDVRSGPAFRSRETFDHGPYDVLDMAPEAVADLLAEDLILGWVTGRCEIGPRALGNRSILAAPFRDATRIRLNEIKGREQFRPIAPACLREDAASLFGCQGDSPHMLYTCRAMTSALAAVTHVNGTARIQTVTGEGNARLHELLVAFKKLTGHGVLCNTSLNFNGRGFINDPRDLHDFATGHGLDGFVIEGRAYLLKTSACYRAYLGTRGPPPGLAVS